MRTKNTRRKPKPSMAPPVNKINFSIKRAPHIVISDDESSNKRKRNGLNNNNDDSDSDSDDASTNGNNNTIRVVLINQSYLQLYL